MRVSTLLLWDDPFICLFIFFFLSEIVWSFHLFSFEDFKPDKGGLSVGAILGIVAAGCVAIAIISTLIWLFLRRRKYDENNGEINELDLTFSVLL